MLIKINFSLFRTHYGISDGKDRSLQNTFSGDNDFTKLFVRKIGGSSF